MSFRSPVPYLSAFRIADAEGFGNCTNQYECEAVCPKSIKAEFISDLNRQYGLAVAKEAIK